MSENRHTAGYVLPLTVFLLLCTILWGSILMLTLSDTHASGVRQVAQVQSRLLARSGWNLALAHVQNGDGAQNFTLSRGDGTISVTMQETPAGIGIRSTGNVNGQLRTVSGTVVLQEVLPEDGETLPGEEDSPETEPEEQNPEYVVQVLERTIL